MTVIDFNTESGRLTLADLLMRQNKEMSVYINRYFGLKVPSNLRKQEYVEHLSQTMLLFPDIWLRQLSEHEIRLLQQLLSVEPGRPVYTDACPLKNRLEGFGLLLVDSANDGRETVYRITADLHQAIRREVEEMMHAPKVQRRWRLEQYCFGLLNLYGLLPLTRMVDIVLKEKIDETADRYEITQLLLNGSLKEQQVEISSGIQRTLYMLSPYLFEVESLHRELQEHQEIREYKEFCQEEVLSAGIYPVPRIVSPYDEKLRRFLKNKLQMDDEQIQYALLTLWINKQSDANPVSVISDILGKRLSGMKMLQEALELCMDYLNTIPCWFLKGYSSDEIFQKYEKPHLHHDPDLSFFQGLNVPVPGSEASPKKVGRNEPCPCGSGKKYKHCCGK